MAFAAYNGGARRVKAAAKGFVGSKPNNYTWDDIKSKPTITGQMRAYVKNILARLS